MQAGNLKLIPVDVGLDSACLRERLRQTHARNERDRDSRRPDIAGDHDPICNVRVHGIHVNDVARLDNLRRTADVGLTNVYRGPIASGRWRSLSAVGTIRSIWSQRAFASGARPPAIRRTSASVSPIFSS